MFKWSRCAFGTFAAVTIALLANVTKAESARSGMAKHNHYVYSLNLEDGRKYVGKTDNISARLKQHFSGRGAAWTKKYKPVSVNHVQMCRTPTTQAKAETIVYKKLAAYHGPKVVRGSYATSSRERGQRQAARAPRGGRPSRQSTRRRR